jgi:hypothetical protein
MVVTAVCMQSLSETVHSRVARSIQQTLMDMSQSTEQS